MLHFVCMSACLSVSPPFNLIGIQLQLISKKEKTKSRYREITKEMARSRDISLIQASTWPNFGGQ